MNDKIRIFDACRLFFSDRAAFGTGVGLLKLLYRFHAAKPQTYQKTILKYTEKKIAPVLSNYQTAGYSSTLCGKIPLSKTPIWFCWLPGEDFMPGYVRLCYQRLLHIAPEKTEVRLLTQKNLYSYLDLPPVFEKRYLERSISQQEMSFLIRVCVLSAYGGLWVDPNLFLLKELPASFFESEYFSPKTKAAELTDSSCGLWNAGFVFAKPNLPIMNFLKDAYIEWLGKIERFPDEAMYDYFLQSAYHSVSEFRQIIDGVPFDKFRIVKPEEQLNQPYSSDYLSRLETYNMIMLIPESIPVYKETPAKKPTVYGYLYFKELFDA